MKMYIAVLDQVPDFMVPTLVAHTVLAAHHHHFIKPNLTCADIVDFGAYKFPQYIDWFENNFSKVVLRVNQKEFDKIAALEHTYLGHENTTLEGRDSCAIPLVCADEDRPNVLKYAKMWAPVKEPTPPRPILEGNENRGGINVKPSEKFITRPAPPTGYRPSESVQPIASAPKSPPPPKPTR